MRFNLKVNKKSLAVLVLKVLDTEVHGTVTPVVIPQIVSHRQRRLAMICI